MSTAVPSRFPSGVSGAYPGELLGLYGSPNPFNIHRFEDDFDWIGASGVKYTQFGTVTKIIGDGGLVQFDTTAVLNTTAGLQLIGAPFTATLGKRMWAGARIRLSDLTAASFVLGFTQGAGPVLPTEGLVIYKPTGATTIFLRNYVAGVANLSVPIPVASFAPAINEDFDIGLFLDHKGYLQAYAATALNGGLFGYMQQVYSSVNRGVVASGQVPALSTLPLTLSLVLNNNAAASQTMVADFLVGAKERL